MALQEQRMLEQLEAEYAGALEALAGTGDSEALKAWESSWLGRRGAITARLRSTGQLPQEERAAFGRRANEIRRLLGEAHEARAASHPGGRAGAGAGERRD